MTVALTGVWRLVEWVKVHAAGPVEHPFTERAQGRVLYAPQGVMAGFLMHPEWPAQGRVSGVQNDGFIAYSGRYDAHDGAIRHYVDMATEPGWVGAVLERYSQAEGPLLVLTTRPVGQQASAAGWLHHRLTFRSEAPGDAGPALPPADLEKGG